MIPSISPEEIKAFRKMLDLTQVEFAELLGLSKVTYSKFEQHGQKTKAHNTLFWLVMYDASNLRSIIEKDVTNVLEKEKKEKIIEILKKSPFFSLKTTCACEMNEHTGYTKISPDKIIRAILFFTINGAIPKNKLLRLLCMADILHYIRYKTSITGLTYRQYDIGPLPTYSQLLDMVSNVEPNIIIEGKFIDGNSQQYVTSNQNPGMDNMGMFTFNELSILFEVSQIYGELSEEEINIALCAIPGMNEITIGETIDFSVFNKS